MKLTLVKKQEEARGTVSFFWKTDLLLTWKPGQYLYYNLDLQKNASVRHFTIASSPTEEVIQLTTRIRGESLYKQTLNKLEIDSVVDASGPRGDFVLDQERDTPQIFLAGGIGITPFRSIIKFATDKGLKTPIHLIYSNGTPDDIAFKSEFDEWTKVNPNFKVSYTITKPEGVNGWNGLTDRIDADMIKTLITDHQSLTTSSFWLCGPPAFVSGMQDELAKLNISGDKIEIEQFTGY